MDRGILADICSFWIFNTGSPGAMKWFVQVLSVARTNGSEICVLPNSLLDIKKISIENIPLGPKVQHMTKFQELVVDRHRRQTLNKK